MNDIPFYYESINLSNSMVDPSNIHANDNATSYFYKKYLFQKAMSVFKFDLPEGWDEDYFKYVLFGKGYISVLYTEEYGVIPQVASFSEGLNIFLKPAKALCGNTSIDSGKLLERSIYYGNPKINRNKQCVIIYVQPCYTSIIDLVNDYGEKLTLMSEALGMNIINSKLAYVFACENGTVSESFKKLFDNIQSGQPAAFADKNLFNEDGTPKWIKFDNNVGGNYISDRILADMRTLENEFDTKVGIPSNKNDKKERMLTDEINANNAETCTLAEMWLDNMKKGCAQVKKVFDVDINIDWRIDPHNLSLANNGIVEGGSIDE